MDTIPANVEPMPFALGEARERKLYGFVEVYITSSNLVAINAVFNTVARKKRDENGHIKIAKTGFNVLQAYRSGKISFSQNLDHREETPHQAIELNIYLGVTEKDKTCADALKALQKLFKSAGLQADDVTASREGQRFTPVAEDEVLQKGLHRPIQPLGTLEPNKFYLRIR